MEANKTKEKSRARDKKSWNEIRLHLGMMIIIILEETQNGKNWNKPAHPIPQALCNYVSKTTSAGAWLWNVQKGLHLAHVWLHVFVHGATKYCFFIAKKKKDSKKCLQFKAETAVKRNKPNGRQIRWSHPVVTSGWLEECFYMPSFHTIIKG